ncbi:MAG: acyltransferase family protein [bacterium]|nr:acyltransferase family protein [bacterium]
MKKRRLNYIDMAKGLGIIMVTYGHITDVGNPIDVWMSTFKITIFFIISGYMVNLLNSYKNISFVDYVKKIFGSIMVPYFSFSILGTAFRFLLFLAKDQDNYKDFLADYVYSTLTLRGATTLWFLPCLFLGLTLLYVVLKKKNKYVIGLTLIWPLIAAYGASLLLGYMEQNLSKFYFILLSYPLLTVAKAIVAVWFLLIGYFSYSILSKLQGKYYRFGLGVLLSLITIYLSRFTSGIDFNNMALGNIPFLFYMLGITGSIGAILVFEFLEHYFKLELFTYFGKNSLILMATQRIFCVINVAYAGWDKVAHMEPTLNFRYYFDCLAILIIVLLMEYTIIEFINSRAPRIMGRRPTGL